MDKQPEHRTVHHEGATRVGIRDGLFVYTISDSALAHGSSLGNAHAWATSKGTGAIQGLFSTDIGREITGSLVVNFFAPYRDLLQYSREEEQGRPVGADTLVRLARIPDGEFTIHPAYQEHLYDLVCDLHVRETFFLPNTGFDDDAVAIQIVEVENRAEREQTIAVIGCLDLPGQTDRDLKARYDIGLGAIIAWNEGNPDWVRVFGTVSNPDAYLVSHDIEEAWNPRYPLANTNNETGAIVGSLQRTIFLRPGESKKTAFIVAFSPNGQTDGIHIYKHTSHYEKLFHNTIERYKSILMSADIMTPDTAINEGVQWCKANMLRVMANYPTGIAFTNDPGKSSNVVVRDAAWFVYGSDFMLPKASCDLLREITSYQKKSGLMIEYYNARTRETDDYGLNINDNTPLYILAGAHHLEVTGHQGCSDIIYPAMVKAADYIISQIDDRGLVYCSAEGTGVRGIAGWRNIIDGRSINGAVTEINAECCAALEATSRVAGMRGDSEQANRFADEAEKLRKAINNHLKNPNNGMYYLNIDIHGNPITEVTADEIFPILFGVADETTSRFITLRLSNPDFMTSAGLRTSSSLNPRYAPDTLVGLEGGVWPGVTWWYAMASTESDPSLMVDSLKRSYLQYNIRPSEFNTVPGQFSEWFDGESLVNRGMRLSPWEPPRFLWAMIEGAVGLNADMCNVTVNPRLPRNWMWLRVRNLGTASGSVGFFAAKHGAELTFYTASSFFKAANVDLYDAELTDLIDTMSPDTVAAAYSRKDGIIACFGNTSSSKKPSPFTTVRMLDNARRYHVELYQSEIEQWIDLGSHSGGDLTRLSVDIAPYGYVLFKFGA